MAGRQQVDGLQRVAGKAHVARLDGAKQVLAKVNLAALEHALHAGPANGLDQFHLHMGEALHIEVQVVGHDAFDELGRGCHLQHARVTAPEPVRPLAHGLGVIQQGATLTQHLLALAAEHEATADAVEKLETEFRLEAADLPRQGRLGDPQLHGRLGDGAELGHGDEGASSAHAIAPALNASLSYDTLRDFAAVDVGCGTGHLGLCLAEDPEILGVQGLDIAPAYIAYARCRSTDSRLGFETGNACDLPYADASFDHTVSMLALQFVPQSDLAVREMRRVTRPGGTVVAATWDTRGGGTVVRMIFDAAALLDPQGGNAARAAAYTRPLSRPGELAHAWRSAGLTQVVQDTVAIRMEFACFHDFWAPVEGQEGPIAQYVASLGSTQRAELREHVQRAYLDGESDGPRSYSATAWVVQGRVPD